MDEKKPKKNHQTKNLQQTNQPPTRAHSLRFVSVDATKINNEEVKACLQLQLLLLFVCMYVCSC